MEFLYQIENRFSSLRKCSTMLMCVETIGIQSTFTLPTLYNQCTILKY